MFGPHATAFAARECLGQAVSVLHDRERVAPQGATGKGVDQTLSKLRHLRLLWSDAAWPVTGPGASRAHTRCRR